MNEPLRKAYSADELLTKYRNFLVAEYGVPRDMLNDARKEFHTRLGIMLHFVGDEFDVLPRLPPKFYCTGSHSFTTSAKCDNCDATRNPTASTR